MHRAILTAFLTVLFCLTAMSGASAAPRVQELRIGQQPNDVLRLVIESNEPLALHVSLLADPYRVVIDLPEVEWTIGAGEGAGYGYINKYRYGLFAVGHSRLVVDLARPALVSRSFTIAPAGNFGHRMVIDLKPVARTAFLEAVKANRPLSPEQRPVPVVAPQRPSEQRVPLIVIDPGHGGNDPGTIAANGKYEKHITLEVAREVKRRLEQSGQFRVVLTRDRDIYIPHRQRFAVARANNADLFISLHADSIPNKTLRGGTIYTLSEKASDAEAAALAAKENKSDIIVGIDLGGESEEVASILIDLAQRETLNYSARFAGILVESLGRDRVIPNKPQRSANFLVLKAPDVPSVLFEMGYLSNRDEAQWLASSTAQRQIADAVTQAARRYFEERLARQF